MQATGGANERRGDNSNRFALNSNGKRGRKENTTDTTVDHESALTSDVAAGSQSNDCSQSDGLRAKRQKTQNTQAKSTGTQRKAKSAHPNVTNTAAEEAKTYTNADVQVFLDSVKNLTDWMSTSVKPRYIALAHWHDIDGLSMKQCAQKWVADGYGVAKPLKGYGNDKKNKTEVPQVSEAAMYKNYNRYAKQLYEENGIAFVPPKARKFPYGNKKPVTAQQTVSSKQPHGDDAEEMEKEEVDQVDVHYPEWMAESAPLSPPQDDEDLMVFSAHSGNASMPPEIQRRTSKEPIRKASKLAPEDVKLANLLSLKKTESKQDKHIIHLDKTHTALTVDSNQPETEARDRDAEIELLKTHRATDNDLSFKREAGDVDRNHPTRPVLSHALVMQHSSLLRRELKVFSDIDTIKYGEDIDESTVTRYIACVSPRLRSSLPTHDIVEMNKDRDDERFRATSIGWAMSELEDLYMFAHTMGTPDICDMVIDRVYEELHRPEQRSTRDKYGRKKTFSVLNFSPGFLTYLHQFDAQGFEFFADILVTEDEDALVAMSAAGLSNWHQDVKLALEDKLESGEGAVVSKENAPAVCSTYHHHPGSADQCYRAKAPTAPLTSVPTQRGMPVSEVTKQTKRLQAFTHKTRHAFEERMDRWGRQRAYHQKTPMRREPNPELVDTDGHIQKRFEDEYDERDGEYVDRASASDSSEDEDGNAITVRLNPEYINSRAVFRNPIEKYEAPGVYAPPPQSGRSRKWIQGQSGRNADATKYREEAIDLIKDSERAALKKYAIVQEKLQMFREYGCDVDGLQAPTPSTAVGSRLGSEDVEMSDKEEEAGS